MIATTILKCILLAKTQVLVLETPVNEYAMATISEDHNGVHFEGTVVEGRMNSVSLEYLKGGPKSMSYSYKDYEQKSLSLTLDHNKQHASLECELLQKN